MAQDDQIQGEGNYDAARRFRKAEEDFVKSGKVDKAATRRKRRWTAPKPPSWSAPGARPARARSAEAKEKGPGFPRGLFEFR